MDQGNDFLKSQVHRAAAQHHAFLKALEDHESNADDSRFRDLCTRYVATMREHQRMLEDYQSQLGAPGSGVIKRAMDATVGVARNLADSAAESDFLRLASDVAMSRQSEETFKVFRDAGRAIGFSRLTEIGEKCEREHDAYNRDANRLLQQMFVERAREGVVAQPSSEAPDLRR